MEKSGSAPRGIGAALFAAGVLALGALFFFSSQIATNTGESLTLNTIRLSLLWYLAAILLRLRWNIRDREAKTALGKTARWCWTWGCLVFLVHLGMAFHYYHHWSHAHAFAHTREVSGLGEGIYVSYFFALWWEADVLWWWISPLSFAHRPVWVDRAQHAFMLFIIFNGTVVYESGPIRWFGLAGFVLLAGAWAMSWRRPKVIAAYSTSPS